jgi:hypothetical protein
MSHESAQRADEEARSSSALSSDANRTGVVGAGVGGPPERTGLLVRDPAGDQSGLLGHFRSPSTAGLAGPVLPDRTGLAGEPSGLGATHPSGLLGSPGPRDGEARPQSRH